MPNGNKDFYEGGAIYFQEDEASHFEWKVPRGGFRWLEEDSGVYLFPAVEWDRIEWKKTQPLENPALFRSFAGLEPTEESVLAFANQHGQLELNEDLRPVCPLWENPSRGLQFAYWTERINEMKRAVQLWEVAQSRDLQAFQGVFKIQDGMVLVVGRQPRSHLRVAGLGTFWELPRPPAELNELEKLTWGAESHVRRIVNRALSQLKLPPRLDEGPSSGTLYLDLEPTSLISAAWLQFAYWTQGAHRYPECRQCGKRFAVAPGAKRGDADYCNDACRYKAYRARKREAWGLKGEGKKNGEIAEILGSDPQTVGRWIREARVQERTIQRRVRSG